KKRVRRRDGNRCVVCDIDEQIHEKRYGRILDVHRIVPGSNYSTDWGVCVTLCEVCHDALHGNGHWGWIATDDPHNDQWLEARVRHSSYRDLDEEETWRKQEAWGAWIKELRFAKLSLSNPKRKLGMPVRRRKRISPIKRFAMLSDLSAKAILDIE